jgi:hypothetical protein
MVRAGFQRFPETQVKRVRVFRQSLAPDLESSGLNETLVASELPFTSLEAVLNFSCQARTRQAALKESVPCAGALHLG